MMDGISNSWKDLYKYILVPWHAYFMLLFIFTSNVPISEWSIVSLVELKVGREQSKTFQEAVKENNSVWRQIAGNKGEKNKGVQYNCIYSFAVSYFSLTHWHAFSQHGYFTCPGSFWTDLCHLAQQCLFLGFSAQAQQVCEIIEIGIGNYKRLRAYFQHLLSTYKDLAMGIGTKNTERSKTEDVPSRSSFMLQWGR